MIPNSPDSVRDDSWKKFCKLTKSVTIKVGAEVDELHEGAGPPSYPKGFRHPWHEEWLCGPRQHGYAGYYLQAILGDCSYKQPRDMCGTYNYTEHNRCRGMSRQEAIDLYIETIEKLLIDTECICSKCSLKDSSQLNEGYRCVCDEPLDDDDDPIDSFKEIFTASGYCLEFNRFGVCNEMGCSSKHMCGLCESAEHGAASCGADRNEEGGDGSPDELE